MWKWRSERKNIQPIREIVNAGKCCLWLLGAGSLDRTNTHTYTNIEIAWKCSSTTMPMMMTMTVIMMLMLMLNFDAVDNTTFFLLFFICHSALFFVFFRHFLLTFTFTAAIRLLYQAENEKKKKILNVNKQKVLNISRLKQSNCFRCTSCERKQQRQRNCNNNCNYNNNNSNKNSNYTCF